MKTTNNIWINLFALAAGILLLVFANESTLFTSIVSIIGILFIVPSAIAFIVTILPPKNPDGTRTVNWFTVFATALGLAFGICLVAVPSFFAAAIIYTLGAILIIAGLAGIGFLVNARDGAGKSILLYIIPALATITGIIIIILGRPRLLDHAAAIISGIALILFSVNGFWACIKNRQTKKIKINNPS